FDDSRPLVFTHGDLSMRNIIFGTDGRIWLVDWALSGFTLVVRVCFDGICGRKRCGT
ncbi:hypothetical protein BJV77DRAFT_958133, partial [Russula vinacea]